MIYKVRPLENTIPTTPSLMKNSLFGLLTIIFLCGQLAPSAQITISDPISISDDSFGYKSPRLGLNADGQPLVFWTRPGGVDAFFISTLADGSFSTPTQIPLDGLNPNLWGGSLGPNMAAYGDDVYVTFEVYGQAIYVSHSGDGGLTWESPVEAFVPPVGRKATIPIVAVDSSGQPYVAYVKTNNAEQDAYYGLVKSDDFGATFSSEVDASSASNEEVCECCNGHLAVAENGDVYVSYRNNEANVRDIWLAKSTDGGDSFESAYDIDQTNWIISGCPSNGPHFTFSGDQVLSTFFSGMGSAGSGVYYSTFDMSQSTAGVTVGVPASDETSGGQNRPRISASGDTLGIVWQETFAGSTEIGMTVSTNGVSGLTTEAFRLTDSPTTQQQPDVLFAGGSFHVVYEDPSSGTVVYQEVSFGGVGIEEARTSPFKFGPNPASDRVLIQSDSYPYELTLVNQLGQTVIEVNVNSPRFNLDIENFPNGIYVLRLVHEKAALNTTLIVK
jgi:hypothetical protein